MTDDDDDGESGDNDGKQKDTVFLLLSQVVKTFSHQRSVDLGNSETLEIGAKCLGRRSKKFCNSRFQRREIVYLTVSQG